MIIIILNSEIFFTDLVDRRASIKLIVCGLSLILNTGPEGLAVISLQKEDSLLSF